MPLSSALGAEKQPVGGDRHSRLFLTHDVPSLAAALTNDGAVEIQGPRPLAAPNSVFGGATLTAHFRKDCPTQRPVCYTPRTWATARALVMSKLAAPVAQNIGTVSSDMVGACAQVTPHARPTAIRGVVIAVRALSLAMTHGAAVTALTRDVVRSAADEAPTATGSSTKVTPSSPFSVSALHAHCPAPQ